MLIFFNGIVQYSLTKLPVLIVLMKHKRGYLMQRVIWQIEYLIYLIYGSPSFHIHMGCLKNIRREKVKKPKHISLAVMLQKNANLGKY